MDQHREDPQADPPPDQAPEPADQAPEPADQAPEPADRATACADPPAETVAPVDETVRLGEPDRPPAAVPPAPGSPTAPGAGVPAGPGTGWGQAPGGSGGDAGGAAGDPWADPGDSGSAGPGGRDGAGEHGSFRRLTRQREGRVVAGIAGGLARYLNVDPVILRIAFVGLTLVRGLGLVLYLLAWLMIPERAGADSPGESVARRLAGAPPWIRVTLLVVGTLIALEAVGPVSTVLIVGLLIGLAVAASNNRGLDAASATADRS